MTAQGLRESIAADLLKLRKRRSVGGWALVLTAGISIVFYAYLVIAHATDPRHHGPAGGLRHFSNAFSTLGLDFGTIAAILIGVEAGAGETADGIFRELAVTGRSRLALFATRIPAALIVTLVVVASGLAIAILVTFLFAASDPIPSAWLVVKSVGWVLLANSVVCILAVGLGALTGSRPTALISLIAWQTIATRLLLNTTALGGARKAVLDAALTQLKPGPHGNGVTMSTLLAVVVIALWAATATTLGAWRTRNRDA